MEEIYCDHTDNLLMFLCFIVKAYEPNCMEGIQGQNTLYTVYLSMNSLLKNWDKKIVEKGINVLP